jgi:hypothetical protein
MLGEIDREFYCSADFCTSRGICELHGVLCCDVIPCPRKHRKWLTPEQFLEEYGEVYPDDWLVWVFNMNERCYVGNYYSAAKELSKRSDTAYWPFIVCACTPWGKPDNDWRPE